MEVVQVPLVILEPSPAASRHSITSENQEKEISDIIPPGPEPEENDIQSEASTLFFVPPTTPSGRYFFENRITSIKRPFPSLVNLKLPYIREIGIKTCIDILSTYFSCEDYKYSAVQFWFLDVITDCLWKLQDECNFPERYQKIVLEWVLYVFTLIADPQKNLSRNEFFKLFNEAMTIANEKIQSGCEILPKPEELFILNNLEESNMSFPSESNQTSYHPVPGESYIAIGMEEEYDFYRLPKPYPIYFSGNTEDNTSDDETLEGKTDEESFCDCEDSVEFYKPNANTPERFLSLSFSSVESVLDENSLSFQQNQDFFWKRSSFDSIKNCLDNSFSEINNNKSSKSETVVKKELTKYLENKSEFICDLEKKIIINNCVLNAIKEFVYDYFYETFQFTLVKLALFTPHYSITQSVNTTWNIPKILKDELKKPKIKQEKKKKEKKDKPKKASKKPKPKKEKPKKAEKKKASAKDKKPAKKKLTKEEKEELEKLKREQERVEEEQRIAEENRRLLFPLKEATDETFFRSIFENWSPPKEKKKPGKDKKEKKKK